MNIALIEDTAIRKSFVLSSIEALRQAYPGLSLSDSLPFPLDEDNYSETIAKIDTLSGGLILLLDLDLSIQSPLSDFALPMRDLMPSEVRIIDEVVGSKYWPGLLIGRQAIKNERLRPLVISIVSSVPRPRRPQEYLETIVARANDKHIKILNYSAPIESSDDAKIVLTEALKAFRVMGNALLRVWARTSEWFVDNREVELNDETVPHSLLRKHDWKCYRRVFESAFGFDLHSDVWGSFESVYALHEVLKTFVGRNYCGTLDAKVTKYNLSSGAVYLLLLMAESTLEADASKRQWKKVITGFDKYPYIASPLFAIQAPEVAKRAALGVYTMLTTLCDPEEKRANVHLDKVNMLDGGKGLELRFSRQWDDSQFAEFVETIHGNSKTLQEVWFSSDHPERLQECLGAVWRALTCSDKGFGAPGSVWMDRNVLKFYSAANKRIAPREVL